MRLKPDDAASKRHHPANLCAICAKTLFEALFEALFQALFQARSVAI